MERELEISSLSKICFEKGIPFTASIEIITKCNLKCKHCYIPCHTMIMQKELLFDLFEQLKELGVFELTLTGGEILIHPNIKEIITYARKLGFRLILFTNLYKIDEELIDFLKENFVFEVSTTLFSMDPAVNDYITGVKGSFENIHKHILQMKEKGIPLEIKTPIMSLNKMGYMEVMQFCKKNNLKFTYTTAITSKTDGDKNPIQYNLKEKDIEKVLRDTEQSQIYGKINAKDYLCPAIRTNLHIDCTGKVYPCISFPYLLGDIHEEDLKTIWLASKAKKYLESIKKAELIQCMSCDYSLFCTRCPGLAYSEDKALVGCSNLDKVIAVARKKIYSKL